MSWFTHNTIDLAAGLPVTLLLPIILSLGLALWLRRVSGWLIWALAFALAVGAYFMLGEMVVGPYGPTGLAIGLSFTCITYLPLTGLSVLAIRLTRYWSQMLRG